MTRRPCGACRALVPADTGCEHWRPGRSVKAAASAAARLNQRIRRFTQADVDAIPVRRRVRTPEYREAENERRRAQRSAERERSPRTRPHRQLASDAERVAQFARIMGRTYR
jgi:hypothetical protein